MLNIENILLTVWFIKIIREFGTTADVTDDYGYKVISGQKCMLGKLQEKVNNNNK